MRRVSFTVKVRRIRDGGQVRSLKVPRDLLLESTMIQCQQQASSHPLITNCIETWRYTIRKRDTKRFESLLEVYSPYVLSVRRRMLPDKGKH